MRERWLGATGRKVPELAVEGELALSAAVVASMVITVGTFVAVQPLIDLARHAVTGSLFF